jgi:GST-like protein
MFQMGGVGPMFGQWNHFGAYAPQKIPYAMERYGNEAKRLTRVLDNRLGETRWLAGDEYSMADKYSMADIINFPWLRTATDPSPRFDERGYIDLGEFPHLMRWFDEISARPAVQRGLQVLENVREQKAITDAEREVYFGKTQFQAR